MATDTHRASLAQIFGVFCKIGAFTIGGGYVMIPLIEAEMRSRGWIPEEDLPDIVVLAQSAPGIVAVNMAVFAGYRLRGVKGSIVAALGAVLPSFLIILAIAALFTNFRDNPTVESIFKGIRPVAIGLILVPAYKLGSKCKRWWSWTLCLASALLVAFLKFSPIYIIITVIVVAVAITFAKEAREGK
ncbi:MAG: chromate transporter [Bacteroidales bacterium]|nr:chromate transporter [Bacteroidales bacterium]